VQRILKFRGFFHDVEQISKIFAPIQAAILQLEKANCTMADCFIQLLSYSTKNKTEDELVAIIQESYLFDNENYSEEIENDNENSELDDNNDLVTDNQYTSNKENNNSDIAMNGNYKFNLEDLIHD
ncbi:14223_t:CDS:2, partial [Gigaspora margarita]